MDKIDTHKFIVTQDNSVYENLIVYGEDYSEAGKSSNRTGVLIKDCIFYGGTEDCFDIVRGSLIRFEGCYFLKPQTYHITIKGGAYDVTFEDCHFGGTPKNSHVELGQYSDYELCGVGRTHKIKFINCTSDDPGIILKLWRADTPWFSGTSVVVKRMPKLIVWIYFTMRKIQQRLQYGKNGRNGACLK